MIFFLSFCQVKAYKNTRNSCVIYKQRHTKVEICCHIRAQSIYFISQRIRYLKENSSHETYQEFRDYENIKGRTNSKNKIFKVHTLGCFRKCDRKRIGNHQATFWFWIRYSFIRSQKMKNRNEFSPQKENLVRSPIKLLACFSVYTKNIRARSRTLYYTYFMLAHGY